VPTDDGDHTSQLVDGAGLGEGMVAVDETAHRAPLVVLELKELEALEPERRLERSDEEDAVLGVVLDGPVVPTHVRPLRSAVLDDEGNSVRLDVELLLHRLELPAGCRDARDRVARQIGEGRELLLKGVAIDAALLADGARGEPPGGLAVRVHRLGFSSHPLDCLLGVGRVQRGRQPLPVARDHVQRAGEPGIESGRHARLARQALDQRLIAIDPNWPVAES